MRLSMEDRPLSVFYHKDADFVSDKSISTQETKQSSKF